MITHTDENGKEVSVTKENADCITTSVHSFAQENSEYILFFNTDRDRLCLKHKSGKIIELYSEYEMKQKKLYT